MIDGVKTKKIVPHYDDRGFFSEILKFGEETFHEIKQTSYGETYPGVIKAFHWHKRKWESWCVVKGSAQVVLYDWRDSSPTKGQTDIFYTGEKNPLLISIPPGVAHGYKVLGAGPIGVIYHVSEPYNPKDPDEERIPFDSPLIGFDWETKNR